jgi:hypothetical protein
MSNLCKPSSLRRFFYNIYKILKETDKKIEEVWCEISEINVLKPLDKYELNDFLQNFKFIKKERGNYIDYIVINKIAFILECIMHLDFDLRNLSEILDFSNFEALIYEILLINNYNAIKNFRFSDKSNFKSKTGQKRYEIDVIGIYNKFILVIDAKQWKRKDSFSSINKAANLQYQRVLALTKNPEVFSDLIHKLLGINPNIKKYLPFKLIPIMVTLENNGIKLNDNQVPLISILELNSFLQEFQIYLEYYKVIDIRNVNVQTQLF